MHRKFMSTLVGFMLLAMFSLSAFSGDGWDLNLQSSLDFNVFRSIDRTERLYDSEYRAGFENNPLLQIDLNLYHGPWTFLSEGSIFSLRPPVALDTLSLFSPLVKLAFLEYDGDFIFFSAGRRKQSIGVSDHSQFVNRDMPFLDGVNVSVGKGRGFRFDSLISVSNTSRIDEYSYTTPFDTTYEDAHGGQYDKYFIYHAFSYVGDSWYVMIGEPAVLGNPKTPADFSIFTNIHNENSERANVGIEFQVAKMFGNTLLTHMTGAIDDLPMLASHSSPIMLAKTPNAVSIGGGIRWHAIQGKQFAYPSFDSDRGIRKNTRFGEMSGGLILSLEYIGTSRWMYVRTSHHHSAATFFPGYQSFYNYFFNPWFESEPDHYALSYGSKYGGDAQLIVLRGTYESKNLKLNGVLELALLGQDAQARFKDTNQWGAATLSTDPNDANYSRNWISSGNIKPLLIVDLSVERGMTDWLTVYGGASLSVSSFLVNNVRGSLGATVQF